MHNEHDNNMVTINATTLRVGEQTAGVSELEIGVPVMGEDDVELVGHCG
jgi:hypothetical protein